MSVCFVTVALLHDNAVIALSTHSSWDIQESSGMSEQAHLHYPFTASLCAYCLSSEFNILTA